MIPVLLLGGAGCGDDTAPAADVTTPAAAVTRAAPNQAPVIESVTLEPTDPTAGDTVRASVSATDADGDPVRMFFNWSVNGEVQSVGHSPQFRPARLQSGDRVTVEVVASDGKGESEPYRVGVSAGNRAPFIRMVSVAPEDGARPGQDLEAVVVAEDPDGDDLRFEYTWFVNGNQRGRSEEVFSTDSLRRGDTVRVRAVARDGRARSKPMESEEIELQNSPPVFAGVPTREEVDGVFFYRLQARDPDGDRSLRFRLAQGPPGMSIDPMSGVLRWEPSASQEGVHPVEVLVSDREGAKSFLSWKVNVSVSRQQAPASRAR